MTFVDNPEVRRTVRNLLSPQRASGKLRCADLYCGDGFATRVARAAGAEVAYAYTPDAGEAERYLEQYGQEPFAGNISDSSEVAPEFDLLLVQVGNWDTQVMIRHVRLLMQGRGLAGVVFWGKGLSNSYITDLWYTVARIPELPEGFTGGTFHDDDLSLAVVSNTHGDSFPWPDVVTLETVIAAFE
ncbi:MAG: hypothetical protein F4W95_11625 [Chloroflexi bacterium]|nr:hypothetical protein [Chloroflexota bacterium]MYD49116.1 hypothetical protein [Chloroflexota bacterium]